MWKMDRRIYFGALLLIVALPIFAHAQTVSVSAMDNSFSPRSLTVSSGTTVTWRNNGSVIHTVTSDSGLFNSGPIYPGQTFSYTFTNPGTFNYYCQPHGAPGGIGMSGSVSVTSMSQYQYPQYPQYNYPQYPMQYQQPYYSYPQNYSQYQQPYYSYPQYGSQYQQSYYYPQYGSQYQQSYQQYGNYYQYNRPYSYYYPNYSSYYNYPYNYSYSSTYPYNYSYSSYPYSSYPYYSRY